MTPQETPHAMPLDTLFADRAPLDCRCPGYADCCICPTAERALRAYAYGPPPAPMTAAQREACLQEIDQVEGYERAAYQHDTDQHLARGVLAAWRDYCRDKGLL